MEQTRKRKALVISSFGELDIAAITLMGLSTKREDSGKIGMFGTGLKYSIAKLLRDRIPFRVWNGSEEVSITTRPGSFRGKDYEQVLVNGETTSITTDMGPQWENWWVVRELLSNARDEQAHEFFVAPWDEVDFVAGWTTFVLDYEAFEQVWLAREKYFVTDRAPKWEGAGLRLYTRWAGEGTRVYKNGILIKETTLNDSFDYDVLDAELNEMREPRNGSHFANDITNLLLTSLSDDRLVSDWFHGLNTNLRYLKETFTGSLWSFQTTDLKLSDAVKHFIDETDQRIHGYEGIGVEMPTDGLLLPADIHRIAKRHSERNKPLELASPTKEQADMLAGVLSTMYSAGVEIHYPIKVADLGPQVIALAVEGTIVLTPNSFKSEQVLVECLLEEAAHLATGHGDGTRQFQTAVFGWWAKTILDLTVPHDNR